MKTAIRASRPNLGRKRRVAVIVTAALVGVFVVGSIVPQLLGFKLYRITSGSMEPTLSTSAVILTRTVAVSELAVGDIVTAQRPGSTRTVTHRVISINVGEGTTELWLRGDANRESDPAPYSVDRVQRYVATLF